MPSDTAATRRAALAARAALRRRPRLRRELPARRVDVAAAREPDRRVDAVLLEDRLERRDRLARGALVHPRRVARDEVDLERAARPEERGHRARLRRRVVDA